MLPETLPVAEPETLTFVGAPVNVAPDGISTVSEIVAFVPLKLALTLPAAVPATETFPSVPENPAEVGTAMLSVTRCTPVPENDAETVASGVPVTETFPSSPLNDALDGTEMFPVTNLAPVPLNSGAVARYAASPVLTVTSEVVIEAPVEAVNLLSERFSLLTEQ